MGDVLESLRLGTALVMLLGASVADLRTRRVRNHYWFPFIAFAATFLLADIATQPAADLLVPYALALGLTLFWYGIWYFGLFGGADAKGLMVLSWLLPFPLHTLYPLPPALDAVSNGAVLVLAYPLAFLLLNLVRGRLRFPAALLGVPMPLELAQARKVWPMQRAVEGKVRWKFWQTIGTPLDDVYRDLRRSGLREVWTTPKVPFMVPIAFGLAATWRYGNIWLHALGGWPA